MKSSVLVSLFSLIFFIGYGQVSPKSAPTPDSHKKLYTVEASCGECSFGLKGDDCDLAIKFNGKPYYVDGPTILDYGHPHDKNGFCVAVRNAEVQGEVVDGRFKASYFKLLDIEPKNSASEKK